MTVSVEVHKIIKFTIPSPIFFASGGGVPANSMSISFSVKHSQTF